MLACGAPCNMLGIFAKMLYVPDIDLLTIFGSSVYYLNKNYISIKSDIAWLFYDTT